MKAFLIVCLFSVACALYSDIDDSLDIVGVVIDPVEMQKYIDCYANKGPCTDVMNGYKKHIKEFVGNKCKDCTPVEKHTIEIFLKTMELKYQDDLTVLRNIYDPDGKNFDMFDKEMAKYER